MIAHNSSRHRHPFAELQKLDPSIGHGLGFVAVVHGDSATLICFLGVCSQFRSLRLFVGYQSFNVFSL